MGEYRVDHYIQIFKDTFDWENDKEIGTVCMENTVEWDSFMQMELILALEERFQVKFCREDILRFVSYEEGIMILKEKGIVLKYDDEQ